MNGLRETNGTQIYTKPPSVDFAQCSPGIPVGILEILLADAGVDARGEKIVRVKVEVEGFGYWRVRIERGGSSRAEFWRVTCDYETDHVTCEKEAADPWRPRNRLSSQTEMCSLN